MCITPSGSSLHPAAKRKKILILFLSFMGQVGRSNGEGGGVGVKERGGQGEGELSETPAG